MALRLWTDDDWFFSDPTKRMDGMFKSLSDTWSPRCDVKESEKEISIHADLPGVPKENINVELKDNVLTISGERKQEKKEDKDKWHRIERSYGKFSRSMAVPKGVTEKDIKATIQNGVLEVSFPKPVEKPKEKIPIHG